MRRTPPPLHFSRFGRRRVDSTDLFPLIILADMASASASSREPWALPEFVREKAERARRLLTEDVRYEGSADLQASL